MTECVLCDWTVDWQAPSIAAYLPGQTVPLTWMPDGPGPVCASDTVTRQGIAGIACVAHWAREHPGQLTAALGGVEPVLRSMMSSARMSS